MQRKDLERRHAWLRWGLKYRNMRPQVRTGGGVMCCRCKAGHCKASSVPPPLPQAPPHHWVAAPLPTTICVAPALQSLPDLAQEWQWGDLDEECQCLLAAVDGELTGL